MLVTCPEAFGYRLAKSFMESFKDTCRTFSIQFLLGVVCVSIQHTSTRNKNPPNLVNLCPLLVTLNPFGFGVNWPWMTQLADFESLTMWLWVAFCDSAKMLSE